MEIAVTLVIQGLAFFLVVLGVMKWLWPPLMNIIEERQKKIAEGLAAGSKAQKELDEAKLKAAELLREARDRSAQIVDQAGKRATEIVDEAKQSAITEGQRLIKQAQEEIALETTRAREALRKQVAKLAVQGASHLLEREIDPGTHAQLLSKLEVELANG
jgi:F-type H+-transporting ATPase subunit b